MPSARNQNHSSHPDAQFLQNSVGATPCRATGSRSARAEWRYRFFFRSFTPGSLPLVNTTPALSKAS